ncbi:MAG: glycosyltransferase family 4 protein [Bacteroidales bacterium]|jgi:glycosyltransferase involved in cell wall biosynthesis|nr:glycosyltransferase family 4 protein [Bacteroidales bacterium]
MIIGFDAKRAFSNHTGLGNYSRYVIRNLSVFCPEHRYRLYAPKDTVYPDIVSIRERNNVASVFPRGFNKIFPSLWRTKTVVSDLVRDGVQLYHGLSGELPVGLEKAGIRSVVTVHDLIFLRYPGYYKPIDRSIYIRKLRYACRKADHIITVSECTQKDVISFFGIDPEKISILYQGCDASFHVPVTDAEKERVQKKYRLPETFLLNVGTIEARKNLLTAVKSLLHLDASIHLVAVGRETAYAGHVKSFVAAHSLESRVHLLTGVPLSDLPAVYQSAAVFVYPSFYEGFGIPLIEALYSRVPVIAALGSCLLEAGGPNSLYLNPEDVQAFASAIHKILNNDVLRDKMVAEGKRYVTRFDDNLLAGQMMQLYQKVMDKKY